MVLPGLRQPFRAMLRALRLTFYVFAGLVALLVLGLWIADIPERRFAATVEALEVGMPRAAVLERLGPPSDEGANCDVAQFVEFEKPNPRPQAQHCAHWIGPSLGFKFYAVGFGSDDRLVWVAYGDS